MTDAVRELPKTAQEAGAAHADALRRQPATDWLGAAARGVVAAMAMSGMRRVSTGLGLLEEEPPKQMAQDAPIVRRLLRRVERSRRREALELAHWAYGGVGGIAYELLFPDGRRPPWSGPAFGLFTWLAFEAGLVPLLGLSHAQENTIRSRVLVAADHVLYGTVVGRLR